MPTLIDRLLKRKPKPVANEKIEYRKQQFDYDCGQTCLGMLGWDGHQIFPEGYIFISDLAEIFGHDINKIPLTKLDENTFFENPHLLTVMMGDTWGRTAIIGFKDQSPYFPIFKMHAIIGFKDQVYCPSLGIFKIKDYRKFILDNLTVGFPIPLAQESNLNLPRLTGCNSQRVL